MSPPIFVIALMFRRYRSTILCEKSVKKQRNDMNLNVGRIKVYRSEALPPCHLSSRVLSLSVSEASPGKAARQEQSSHSRL